MAFQESLFNNFYLSKLIFLWQYTHCTFDEVKKKITLAGREKAQ